MGRFNPSTYSPADDTSFDLIPEANKTGLVHIDRTSGKGVESEQRLCHCGCGQETQGTKSMFRMGHDSRFKGILLRAHLTGTEMAVHTSGAINYYKALDLAREYDTPKYAWSDALLAAESKHSDKPVKPVSSKGPKVGDPRLIKVGRWEYTGHIVAVASDGLHVEYTTSKGETKTTVVPAK